MLHPTISASLEIGVTLITTSFYIHEPLKLIPPAVESFYCRSPSWSGLPNPPPLSFFWRPPASACCSTKSTLRARAASSSSPSEDGWTTSAPTPPLPSPRSKHCMRTSVVCRVTGELFPLLHVQTSRHRRPRSGSDGIVRWHVRWVWMARAATTRPR